MNRDWKYVVIQVPGTGMEMPVLLPPAGIEHKLVARMGTPVSAGFCEFCDNNTKVYAFGKSVSLGLAARPEHDAKLLFVFFCRPLMQPERPLAVGHEFPKV